MSQVEIRRFTMLAMKPSCASHILDQIKKGYCDMGEGGTRDGLELGRNPETGRTDVKGARALFGIRGEAGLEARVGMEPTKRRIKVLTFRLRA